MGVAGFEWEGCTSGRGRPGAVGQRLVAMTGGGMGHGGDRSVQESASSLEYAVGMASVVV